MQEEIQLKKDTAELFLSIVEEAVRDNDTSRLLSFVVSLSALKEYGFDFLKIVRYLDDEFGFVFDFRKLELVITKEVKPFDSLRYKHVSLLSVYNELIDKGGKSWRGIHTFTYGEVVDLEVSVCNTNDDKLINKYYKALDKLSGRGREFGHFGVPKDSRYNKYKIKIKRK